ncbi:MAG: alpha/beta fold hydrolase [Promethearchaeota archaeon]|jgi:pimeloyl-ACP methyl ester carboxylesterase
MPKQKVKDIEMYYEITGEGDPLLLIHGLGSSTRDWEEQVPVFSQKYQVITIDLRGHGKTDKPKGPYSIKMFVEDISELLKQLKINKTHILGLSLGGVTAFQFAVDYPQLLNSLIIVNAGVEMRVDSFKQKREFLKRSIIIRLVGMKKMGEVLATRLFIKPEQEEQRTKMIERWAENDKKAYLSALYSLKGWSVRDKLPNITSPTLILGSDEDYTPSSVKKEFVALIPNGKFIEIKDARHAVSMEKPEEFNEIIMNFLAEHS